MLERGERHLPLAGLNQNYFHVRKFTMKGVLVGIYPYAYSTSLQLGAVAFYNNKHVSKDKGVTALPVSAHTYDDVISR